MPTLIIADNGDVRSIYDDETADFLRTLGIVSTRRASHVEPAADGWTADMAPVGGPVLGPFRTRAQALEAEAAWILEHNIPAVGQ